MFETFDVLVPLDGARLKRPFSVRVVAHGAPECVVFLGFSNEAAAVRRAAGLLYKQGRRNFAMVSALPFWALRGQPYDLVEAAGLATVHTVAAVCTQRYGQAPRAAVAESQPSPVLIMAAAQSPELFPGGISLLHPLGFTPLSPRQFTARMARGLLDWELVSDHWVPYMTLVGSWRSLQDAWHGGKQMRHGLATDSRKAFVKLMKQRPDKVRIFVGERDRVFTIDDVRAVLDELGHKEVLKIVPGGHYSPATRAGSRQLAAALAWLG